MKTLLTQELLSQLSQIDRASQFLVVRNYRPVSRPGKVADYNLVINFDYRTAVEKSLKLLETKIRPTKKRAKGKPFSYEDLCVAHAELVVSLNDTLNGKQKNYTCKDVYDSMEPEFKPGKVHIDSGNLHIYGMIVGQRVHEEGEKKEKNSAPKTLAKDYLRSLLPIGRIGQFRLTPENCEEVRVRKMTVKVRRKSSL